MIIEYQSSSVSLRSTASPPLGEAKKILFGFSVTQSTLPRDVSTALRLLNMTQRGQRFREMKGGSSLICQKNLKNITYLIDIHMNACYNHSVKKISEDEKQ